MRLSAPTNRTFFLSLVLFAAGLAAKFAGIAAVEPYSWRLLFASYTVLLVGNLFKYL